MQPRMLNRQPTNGNGEQWNEDDAADKAGVKLVTEEELAMPEDREPAQAIATPIANEEPKQVAPRFDAAKLANFIADALTNDTVRCWVEGDHFHTEQFIREGKRLYRRLISIRFADVSKHTVELIK